MSRRLSMLPPALLLGACLMVLPACKKKPTDTDGGGGGDPAVGAGGAGGTPGAGSSDYFVFARLNAKSIREGALFTEVKQAIGKAGAGADWDKLEAKAASDIGVKPTDIDTVTVCVTDAPAKGELKFVLIVSANKAFDKNALLKKEKTTTPDARGFYKVGSGNMLHFPDDKTFVLIHPDLAQQYLDGYAKNRSGWPMISNLALSAASHTLFVSMNVQKFPTNEDANTKEQFAPLLAAKTVTLTADLKGKELSATLRGSFPDAATAGKAKEMVQGFMGMAGGMINQFAGPNAPPEFAGFAPAVGGVQQTLKAIKLEVAGSDVVASASYKMDFDVGAMVAAAVKQIGEAGGHMTAQNNLKQIGIALHNYHSTYNRVPIHGVGANGQPLRNATDKPLLSWRVAILPYIEQDNLYRQFKLNEPWDSEHNKKLVPLMPKIFAPTETPGKPGFTHLQMVIGPNALQPPFAISPTSLPDGTSNTIAVIEAANAVEWTKPDDVMLPAKLNPGDLKKKFGGQFPGGFNVLMWDGSVRFVPDSVSERTLSLALNPRDGQVLGADWNAPVRPSGKK